MSDSPSAIRRGWLCLPLFAAAALVIASAVPAPAQVSKAEAGCRTAIAKATSKYMKAFGKAVVACHKSRDLDAGAASTDCNDIDQADPDGKVAALATSARAGIVAKCAEAPAVLDAYTRCPAPVEDVDDGLPTGGIDSFGELADCVLAQAEVVAGKAASNVMGSPAPPLNEDLAGCHASLGAAYTKVIDTTMKVRAKCQKSADKAGGSLEFSCGTADPSDKIQSATEKGKAAITAACTLTGAAPARSMRAVSLAELDSCADTPDALADCTVEEEADVAADGAAAMAFELPGNCPAAGSYGVATSQEGTEVDAGWRGVAHDMDPILGYRAVQFPVTCDEDCNNCVSGTPVPAAEACRCSGDASDVCATNGDCTAGVCECFFGPPTSYAAGNTPACVTTRIAGTISGSLNPDTGDVSLSVPIRGRIYFGYDLVQPCPVCVAGICNSGAREDLPCSVDGVDATVGGVSYDCPPDPGSNLSGQGLGTTLSYTTGPVSMPFGTKCDNPPTADCACAACSTDSSIGCNSNSDCLGARVCSGSSQFSCTVDANCQGVDASPCNTSIGLCQKAFGIPCTTNAQCTNVNVGTCSPSTCTSNAGSPRAANACSSGICSPVAGEPGEGKCAGQFDRFCDGFLRPNGSGMIHCSNNGDCTGYTCPGGDCGDCTLDQERECFLNPITATGVPGQTIVGTGCFGGTGNPSVDAALGIPGAFRVRQNIAFDNGLCADGVTPFIPPGGSNCP